MTMKSRCTDIIKSVGNVSLSHILSTTILLVSACVPNGPFVAPLSVIEIQAPLAIKVKIERSLMDCKSKALDQRQSCSENWVAKSRFSKNLNNPVKKRNPLLLLQAKELFNFLS